MSDNVENVTILGTGPAGLTAAVYNARANLEPLIIEGIQPGGQLTITTDVENYPGFPEGVQGPEMMDKFRAQAERFGTRFIQGECTEVDLSKRPFTLSVGDKKIQTNALIISTGATAKLLGLENESRLMGFGVSACATCDGFFYKDKEVIVVGGGDTAMEEALFLTKMCRKVYVAHRREELRASKIMAERALKNEKIEFIWNTQVTDMVGEPDQGGLTAVKLKNTQSGEESEMKIDGIFIAIGHKPNTELFAGVLEMNDAGYLKVKPGCTYTNVEGVFAAGDVADAVYRQAVTAAGTGCMAAIDAERWLAEQGIE